jgi:phage/plasmid primase-like uncharacterized protein
MSANDSRLLSAEDERQFLAAMHSRDLALEPGKRLVANGEWQSCTVVSKGRAGKNDGRYVLHADGPAPWGFFHNWTDGKEPDHWRGDRHRNLTEPELEELEHHMEEVRIEHERVAAEMAKAAALEAKKWWDRAPDAPASHPYLRKKQIKPHDGVRIDGDCLLVPIYSPDNKLVNLQLISTKGAKWFLRGGRVKGCFYRIPGNKLERIVVVEGFATGATVNEATGYDIAVAFNAGNLAAVTNMIRQNLANIDDSIWRAHDATAEADGLRHEHRQHFVDAQIVIGADDDWKTEGNPGVMKGLQAAREAKALIAIPRFDEDRADKDTDFNDLANRYNLAAVREDIKKAVEPEVLFEKRLIAEPQSAHSDANIRELAAWKQCNEVVYQKIRARLLEKKRANIRELDKAVKARIEHDAAKARARKRSAEKVDIEALEKSAKDIIECEDVLEKFADEHNRLYVGERNNAKLLYLIYTTRLFALKNNMHAIIKGPSAVGKSCFLSTVAMFMPPESVFPFTSLSEKALLYLPDGGNLEHKILIMAEVPKDEKQQQFQNLCLRELMSEGVLRYPVVQKVGDEMVTVIIEVKGPVTFAVSTTKNEIDPENETRMLSLEMDDSPEQTKRVMALVAEIKGFNLGPEQIDFEPWYAYQRCLAAGERRVYVPFAVCLVDLIEAKSVRLRRDIAQLLYAIKAHALLHRQHRARGRTTGAIMATLEDYEAVRELMVDPMSESAEIKMRRSLPETVKAVRKASAQKEGATVNEVAAVLGLDRSPTSRRLDQAIRAGHVALAEERKGRSYLYTTTKARMNRDSELLPTVREVEDALDEEDRRRAYSR